MTAGQAALGPGLGGPPRENPYVGLVPFGEEDVPWFFGRDREQQIIGANLRSSRLTLLYGASGVGKSSVLLAAVLPDLRAVVARDRAARELDDPATRGPVRFAVSVFSSWRDAPLQGLTSAVAASVCEATGEQVEPWTPGAPLRETFATWLGPVTTLLIVLDQFEEHVLYHPHDDGPGTFAGEFVDVVNDPSLRVNFLLSLRADGLAKLDRFQGRVPRLFENYLRVDHLDLMAARHAIEGPRDEYNRRLTAGSVGAEIDPELIDAVLAEVRTREPAVDDARGPAQEGPAGAAQAGRVETPLLQLVMHRLWQAAAADAAPPHLRLATLREQLGGTERIVFRHLEEALAALPDERRDLAVDVLRPLVSPAGTKIAWRAADLAYWAKRPVTEIEPILLELSSGERRILRAVMPPPEQADQSPRFEIFHDVLAEPVLEWCAEREAQRTRAQLARELEVEQRERRDAEVRRRRERRNRALAIILGALAIGLIVAVVAVLERSKVADSRALAASATAQLPVDPERGLLLALKAVDRRDTTQAEQALRRAITASRVRAVLAGGRSGRCRTCAAMATSAPIGNANGAVAKPLAIAPDGRTVAGTVRGVLRLWRPQTGATFRTGTRLGNVHAMAFTPDAARLLVVGERSTAVMDPDGTRAVALRGADVTGFSGATSSDGRRVVTTGAGGAAVWDARTGDRLARVTDFGYRAAAFQTAQRIVLLDVEGYLVQWRWRAQRTSSDPLAPRELGERTKGLLAVGAGLAVDGVARGRARVVGAGGGTLVLPSGNATDPVTDAVINPDGSRIATVRESLVELWGSRRRWRATPTPVGRLVHDDGVTDVVFSADGTLMGTASTDGTARVWESATGELLAQLRGHSSGIEALAFSSRGRFVATVGEDLTIRLWDLGRELTLRGRGSVVAMAVAPSGSQIAVVEERGALRIWRVSALGAGLPQRTGANTNPPRPGPSASPPAAVPPSIAAPANLVATTAAFAAHGSSLLVGYADVESDAPAGRVRLMDSAGHVRVDIPTGGLVSNLALDADARVAAIVRDTKRGDTRVELWSLAARRPAMALWRVPLSDSERATDVALSPDGRRLLVTSVYGLARIYDIAAREPLRTLAADTAAHPGPDAFYRGAFSPDGRTVVVAGSRDVRLWDSDSGVERGFRLRGGVSVLRSVAYSADGRRIVTASADGTARVWDAGSGSSLAVLARHTGRVNAAAFLPNGWIVSGGEDRTVRAYPCDSCVSDARLADIAARQVTRRLSSRELGQFGG